MNNSLNDDNNHHHHYHNDNDNHNKKKKKIMTLKDTFIDFVLSILCTAISSMHASAAMVRYETRTKLSCPVV